MEPVANTLHPWWWRTRYKMAPVYAVVSDILFGLLLKLWENTTQMVFFLIVVVFFLTVLINARYGGGKKKGKGKKADPGMKMFLYVCMAIYFGLMLAIRFSVFSTGWLLITLAVAFVGLGLFWWFDQRNLRTQEIEDELRRWPSMAKKLGIPNVKKGVTRMTPTGKVTRLFWNPGDATLETVQSRARLLESAWSIAHKQIRFIPVRNEDDHTMPNAIDVAENTKNPALKAPVPFDKPIMRTVYDEMVIGPLENQELYKVAWYVRNFGGKHTLAGGRSRSGKSGLYDLFLAESSLCLDMVRWGMDRKGGMTLVPWAPLFDWLVTDEAGSESMLVAIREVLEQRSAYAAQKGWRVWRASAKAPLIVLIIDECAEVLGDGSAGWNNSDIANSIARMGAAAGVLLLLATQHPTTAALSSTQLTKNLSRRFCFSVEDGGGQRAILPNSFEIVDATQIPLGPKHAGTCYTSEGGVVNPLSLRVRYVTEEKVRELLTDIGDNVSRLDKLSSEAARKATEKYKEAAYGRRRIWLLEDLPPLTEDVPEDPDDETDDDDEEPMAVASLAAPEPDDTEPEDGTDEPPVSLAKRSSAPPPPSADDPAGDMSLAEMAATLDQSEIDRLLAEYLANHRDDESISTESARARFNAALDAAGPQGITPKKLREACGRKESTVYQWLQDERFAEPPRVDWAARGVYRRPVGWRSPEKVNAS